MSKEVVPSHQRKNQIPSADGAKGDDGLVLKKYSPPDGIYVVSKFDF